MKKNAILFPGQGSQYIGMGNKFSEVPGFSEIMEKALDFLGDEFKGLLNEGPLEKLSETRFAQPLIYILSYSLYTILKETPIPAPTLLAGHSLGEITALTCAGAIDFETGLHIVKKRGELMTIPRPGGMAAIIGLKEEVVMEMCKTISGDEGRLFPANINSNSQIVLSGTPEALKKAKQMSSEKGGRYIPLNVSAPFHSPFMSEAAEAFGEELRRYRYTPLKIPVLSNVDAEFYSAPGEIPEKLTKQLTSPVQWIKIMNRLEQEEINLCIEAGPKNVLTGLVGRETKSIKCLALDQKADFDFIFNNNLKTMQFCIKHAITTRNNDPAGEEYEAKVLIPYKQIVSRYYAARKSRENPEDDLIVDSVKMLLSVFETKKLPGVEQSERLKEVYGSITNINLLNKLKREGLYHE